MSRILDGAALCDPFDEFGFISCAAQFCFPAVFAIPPVNILRYCPRAVQDYTDSSGYITPRYCLFTAAQMDMSLRFIIDLVAKKVAR